MIPQQPRGTAAGMRVARPRRRRDQRAVQTGNQQRRAVHVVVAATEEERKLLLSVVGLVVDHIEVESDHRGLGRERGDPADGERMSQGGAARIEYPALGRDSVGCENSAPPSEDGRDAPKLTSCLSAWKARVSERRRGVHRVIGRGALLR